LGKERTGGGEALREVELVSEVGWMLFKSWECKKSVSYVRIKTNDQEGQTRGNNHIISLYLLLSSILHSLQLCFLPTFEC